MRTAERAINKIMVRDNNHENTATHLGLELLITLI
jgi:hypothetical protein